MRPCLRCGKDIPKKPHESKARYEGKKFCSQVCAKAYMKENKIGWFSNDIHTQRTNRKDWFDETDITETTND